MPNNKNYYFFQESAILLSIYVCLHPNIHKMEILESQQFWWWKFFFFLFLIESNKIQNFQPCQILQGNLLHTISSGKKESDRGRNRTLTIRAEIWYSYPLNYPAREIKKPRTTPQKNRRSLLRGLSGSYWVRTSDPLLVRQMLWTSWAKLPFF